MSKFEQLISQYSNILNEMPVQPGQPGQPGQQGQLDLTALDKATGEQIKNGIAELMGNPNEEQLNQVLQGLVNSKSINPKQSTAAPVATQQAATSKVANQTSAPQNNPAVTDSERNILKQPTI